MRVYQNQYVREETASGDALMLLGRPFYGSNVGLNTYLTTAEISLLAGLPQKEVPGVSLKEGIGFGLNEKEIDDEESINLGNIYFTIESSDTVYPKRSNFPFVITPSFNI